MKKTVIISFLSIVLAFFGCVEAVVLDYSINQKITIIEGQLTNELNSPPILLKEAQPNPSGGINLTLIKGAKVSILVDGKTTVNLTEKDEGYYHYPPGFKGEVGLSYQLSFTTQNGDLFQSTTEKLLKPNAIGSVYQKVEEKGIVDAKGKTSPAYYIYVDTPNSAEVEDFLMWDYQLYEKQYTCKTCTGGYYYKDPLPNGQCVTDALLSRYNNIFDYQCSGNCWEIIHSSELITASDAFYNGKTIKGQLVAKIPFYSQSNALLDINQFSISKGAYKFLELTKKQGIETGGLADTPPASLVGNIKCINKPTENVSGYFIIAGVQKTHYWFDKNEIFDKGFPIVGLLGGRAIKYEPSGANTTRPPHAPCLPSRTRTNIQPEGWKN